MTGKLVKARPAALVPNAGTQVKSLGSGINKGVVEKPFRVVFEQVLNKGGKESNLRDSISQLIATWDRTNLKTDKLIGQLPPKTRALFELQRSINNLNLQANLITKAADGVGATLKRLQGMGG